MNKKRWGRLWLHGLSVALLVGCIAGALAAASNDQESAQDPAARAPIRLVGDGATFPAPLYLRWFRDYYKLHPNVRVDYQGTSSAGGIKDLIAGLVDFAGSDLRMTQQEEAQIKGGVRQVPMTAGAIVLVYNLDGVDDLKLSRSTLVAILTGRAERWNDPLVVTDNPGVALPDAPITVIVRGDGSGTTYHLTRHLSRASPEFAEVIGATMSPNWPKSLKKRGMLIRGKGNEGVAAFVRAIPASIGYVQYSYGYLSGMSMAKLQNRAGNLVAPSQASFEAAVDAISADPDPNSIADPGGDASYPIIALSWFLMRNDLEDSAKRRALSDVIDYALGPGQEMSERLGYIRFSSRATDYVRAVLRDQSRSQD